jgi:major vault protein
VITVETADFVKIAIRVSYSVTFSPEHRDRWFNHVNYIQVMCEHLRSLIRGRGRTLSLSALWPQIPTLVRDTILGEKSPAGTRPGRVFGENGSTVTEVEVLTATIEDDEIAQLMHHVQSESVTLQIGDRQAQEALASAKLRAEVDKQTQVLQREACEREAELKQIARKLAHDDRLAHTRDAELEAREQQTLADARLAAAERASLERSSHAKAIELELMARDADTRAAAHRVVHAAELETQARVRELEVLLIQAQSAATVAERNAVQRGLIEAMTALGDKIMLAEVAENMNLVSLFKGRDVGTILADVLGGTKVMPTVRALIEKFGTGQLAAPANGEATKS